MLINSIHKSKTDFYTVSQLPALPDQIRGLQTGKLSPPAAILSLTRVTEPLACNFQTGHGYALALTHSHAFIWPYSISTSSLSPADVFTLPLPQSCRDPTMAAPLGVLLSTAATGPPGLMVTIPSSGEVVYWETVSSATSLRLSKYGQNGLQGSISGLLSGEHVTDLVNGEPSGVIATLSSGRVAHLTVRNSQGKPTVISNILRNPSDGGSTGFFGGIRNVLGGGFWRKEIAATRPGKSYQRGQRDVIVATTEGVVEIWDTHWNNGGMIKKQFDIRQHLNDSIRPERMEESGDSNVKILDIAFATCDHLDMHEPQPANTETWPLYFLVGLPQESGSKRLWVVQMILSDAAHLVSTHSIDLHNPRPNMKERKARLFVPRSGNMGFITMGQSIVLISMSPFGESSTSQLLPESRYLPRLYDTVDFRCGMEYEILGSGFEESNDDGPSPACLVMVRGFGIIRVTASPHQSVDINGGQVTTAKHKLEQAVFYGTMLGNPLDLASKGGLDFPAKEIEHAALEISRELLRSDSKFIPSVGISLDQNLKSRAKALDDLASLLMQHGLPLDGLVWWELLWGAEKLAAQKAMWKVEEDLRKSSDKPSFLSRVIESMSEKFKTKFDSRGCEIDPVRYWFLHDTYQMEHIIPWIFGTIKPQKGQSKQGRRMADQILEASEFSLAVLETAFRFRDEHASLYGVNEEFLEDGVLVTGYEDLPEPWTSHKMAYVETGHLLDLELGSCMAWVQHSKSVSDAPESRITRDIAKNCSRQLRVFSQMHSERIRWLSAQGDPKSMDEVVATEQAHSKHRRWLLFKLAGVGQLDNAISLAEKFRDMGALVELIIELQDQTKCQLLPDLVSENDLDSADDESGNLGGKISHYFEKFGEPWADAFFSRQISMGQSGVLFAMKKFQPFVTRFLRKSSIYPQLSWINDVVGENDYGAATLSLEKLAIEHESDLWSHRVELSLAKLAKIAAGEGTGSVDATVLQPDVRRLEDYAEIDVVEEIVYEHIAPTLQGALDKKAEIDLAVEQFGKHIADDMPSLHEILCSALEQAVTRQVTNVHMLIDLLTLLDTGPAPDHGASGLFGREFYLALRVIRLGSSDMQSDKIYALQKLIWRRCMLKDNWVATGEIAESMDDEAHSIIHDTALFHTFVLCLKDRKYSIHT